VNKDVEIPSLKEGDNSMMGEEEGGRVEQRKKSSQRPGGGAKRHCPRAQHNLYKKDRWKKGRGEKKCPNSSGKKEHHNQARTPQDYFNKRLVRPGVDKKDVLGIFN